MKKLLYCPIVFALLILTAGMEYYRPLHNAFFQLPNGEINIHETNDFTPAAPGGIKTTAG